MLERRDIVCRPSSIIIFSSEEPVTPASDVPTIRQVSLYSRKDRFYWSIKSRSFENLAEAISDIDDFCQTDNCLLDRGHRLLAIGAFGRQLNLDGRYINKLV